MARCVMDLESDQTSVMNARARAGGCEAERKLLEVCRVGSAEPALSCRARSQMMRIVDLQPVFRDERRGEENEKCDLFP